MPGFPVTVERRLTCRACEVRSKGEASVFVGRAVVYGQWSELLYGFMREQIARGAFDESLASDREIFATIDHDPARTLGRTGSETLRLMPGNEGIDVECDIADYTYAKDLRVAIERGDLEGMSFIMDVIDFETQRPESKSEDYRQIVKKADLYEVSFVFTPAYPQTTASMRGLPIAWPVAGEQRRKDAAQRLERPSLAMRRRRLGLLERTL